MAKKSVVIAGGVFGGLFTALELIGDADVTLVSAEDHFLFRPLLYEYLSGEVERWQIAPAFEHLLDGDVRFRHATLLGADFQEHKLFLGPPVPPEPLPFASGTGNGNGNGGHSGDTSPSVLPYDVLVLALGSVTNFGGVDGADKYCFPFRALMHADALRERMIQTLDAVSARSTAEDLRAQAAFVVIGAGASGVELSTKMADLLRAGLQRRGIHGSARVTVIETGPTIVPHMNSGIRRIAQQALQRTQVEVVTETHVRQVLPTGVVYSSRNTCTHVDAAAVVWAGGVRVNPLITKLALPRDNRDLVLVEPTLLVPGHPDVFAIGDIALFPDVKPILAGTAQLAFQQAHATARNIRALIHGKPLAPGRFVELGQALSLGTRRGAVLVGKRAFRGRLARQARFALYAFRLPTWQHRLQVGASWFLEGKAPRPLLLDR